MTRDLVELEPHGAVAVLRLVGKSSLNPLTDELIDALGARLREIDANPDFKLGLLFGSAKAFAAGADIDAMSRLAYIEAFGQDYIGRNWETIRIRRKPLVAAVAGYALGGGCELAMMCDIVMAAEDAVFGQPEVRLGIVPGAGGTQRLPRAVGKALAMDLCLSGRHLGAQDALAAGLVSRIVPTADLETEALALGQTIAAHSLPVLMAIKEAVDRSFESSLADGLLFERRQFQAGFSLQDQKEGMRAFLERRKPEFLNR
jgi:enoyl-CoA hydratase